MATKLLDYTFNTSIYVFGVPHMPMNVGQEVDKGVKGNSYIESIVGVRVIALGTLSMLDVVTSMLFVPSLE
jgi:hypothetical protein